MPKAWLILNHVVSHLIILNSKINRSFFKKGRYVLLFW